VLIPTVTLAVLLAAMTASIILMRLNQSAASPPLLIADRWLRWIIFAIGGAYLASEYQLIERPFWTLAGAFFLVWFLVVTLYDWLAISAHSLSPLPLFPSYSVNSSGDEWPVRPRLLKTREWLRAQGFRPVQALKSEIGGGIYLRTSIYQDAPATMRVQVSFIPHSSGSVAVCFAVSSVTTDGTRFLTDNLFIPFAGFYPENWFVERSPWRRSLEGLMRRHRRRLETAGVAANLAPFTDEPLDDLNSVQRELDRLNTELGFLHPYPKRDDLGKFTSEGRYRVWKEIWTLNYLGRAARYE